MEETELKIDLSEFEEVDEKEFNTLYESLKEYLDDPEKIATVSPGTKLDAREWAMSLLRVEDEIEWLKSEYIPRMIEKYIKPSKDKIEQHSRVVDILRHGIRQFLDNAEEKNVCFPDLGTFSKYDPPVKIIYPEKDEEKELIEKLWNEENKFVVPKPAFDKKKIMEYFKENKKVPISDLKVEQGIPSIKVSRAKK